ncbi:hypothetical protein GYH30_006272 [Glycine max]|nr:hypothetical protein GYH30_006272 [Glycine max]
MVKKVMGFADKVYKKANKRGKVLPSCFNVGNGLSKDYKAQKEIHRLRSTSFGQFVTLVKNGSLQLTHTILDFQIHVAASYGVVPKVFPSFFFFFYNSYEVTDRTVKTWQVSIFLHNIYFLCEEMKIYLGLISILYDIRASFSFSFTAPWYLIFVFLFLFSSNL